MITRSSGTAAGYATPPWTARPSWAPLAGLTGALLPHLEREETEAMPVVAATLSQADWRAYEHEHAVGVKTFLGSATRATAVLDAPGRGAPHWPRWRRAGGAPVRVV